MYRHRIASLATAMLLWAVPAGGAQQPGHPTTATAGSDMLAMHCSGDMADMMMPGRGMRGMGGTRMDSMTMRMRSDTMMQHMMVDLMGPPSPAMVLRHKDQLGLNAEQVRGLEALQKDAEAACITHMRAAMATHRAANRLLEANAPDFAAYSAKMKEAAGDMAEAIVAMAKASVGARNLLTATQQETLKTAMETMHPRP